MLNCSCAIQGLVVYSCQRTPLQVVFKSKIQFVRCWDIFRPIVTKVTALNGCTDVLLQKISKMLTFKI